MVSAQHIDRMVAHAYLCDGVKGLQYVTSRGLKASLVYIDPPFYTQRSYYHYKTKELCFYDRWESLDHYIQHIQSMMLAAQSVCDGTIIIHIDQKVSHHIRLLGERVFGVDIASEIVWSYRRWPSPTPNLQRLHDTLYRWTFENYTFNQLYDELAESTKKTFGTSKQHKIGGKSVRTNDKTNGAALGDVWHISVIAPVAKERTGYPTQKPLKLLDRIMKLCTRPGQLVIDPCCGSGTTLVAAVQNGCNALGFDTSSIAVNTSNDRIRRRNG